MYLRAQSDQPEQWCLPGAVAEVRTSTAGAPCNRPRPHQRQLYAHFMMWSATESMIKLLVKRRRPLVRPRPATRTRAAALTAAAAA